MDIDKIMLNPANFFETPEQIAESTGLTKDEKIKILESWAYDIDELERADTENMPGTNSGRVYTLLRRIRNIILELQEK